MTERWYSVDEIAAHLGIVRETVYRWIAREALPAHRIGKFWKLRVSEVDEWATSGRMEAEDADPILDRDPVLREIVERLIASLNPERIYLFGSKARGDADSDSDYDILVLIERPTERRYRLSQAGYRALRGIQAAVDILVWDRATFDARLHLKASFPATVVREGKLLHAS